VQAPVCTSELVGTAQQSLHRRRAM